MGMVINQYEIYLVDLEPTKGSEIQKIQPCVVISPNEMNHNIRTVIVAPMTTKSHDYPTRVSIYFEGKNGWIVLDQIRTIDKSRLIKKMGIIKEAQKKQVKQILKELLVD